MKSLRTSNFRKGIWTLGFEPKPGWIMSDVHYSIVYNRKIIETIYRLKTGLLIFLPVTPPPMLFSQIYPSWLILFGSEFILPVTQAKETLMPLDSFLARWIAKPGSISRIQPTHHLHLCPKGQGSNPTPSKGSSGSRESCPHPAPPHSQFSRHSLQESFCGERQVTSLTRTLLRLPRTRKTRLKFTMT